jgi:hypothetical protein
MGHLFHQAGLPAGVLNILPGFGETAGNALAMHTDVDKVGLMAVVISPFPASANWLSTDNGDAHWSPPST